MLPRSRPLQGRQQHPQLLPISEQHFALPPPAIEQATPLAIADVLYQITQTRYETEPIIRNWDVPLRYPRQVCRLLENSILKRSHLTSAFPWSGAKNRDVTLHSIQALGRIGSLRTVAVLKTIVDDPELGLPALAAIREIETVGTLAAAASERERR